MCEADLRAQAMELVDAGYYVASVATSRCDLEWNLNEVARGVAYLNCDPFTTLRTGGAAMYLKNRDIVSKVFQKRVDKVLRRAAHMIHDGNANCLRAMWVVYEVAGLLDELKGRAPRALR